MAAHGLPHLSACKCSAKDDKYKPPQLFLMHQAAEIMKTLQGGNIVNITISRARGVRNKFSHVVSKGGINSLPGCAAADLAPFGIRVNSIGIGPTGTPVGRKEYPDRNRGEANPGSATGRIGHPEEIAAAVSFLVSDKASYIWGTTVNVDGGGGLSGQGINRRSNEGCTSIWSVAFGGCFGVGNNGSTLECCGKEEQ